MPNSLNYDIRYTFSKRLRKILLNPFAGAVMSTIYDDKKDGDGFLYVSYSGENTFG